jgi:cytochrome c biogenesis protein CcmG/thiol:disulfide interchange protein DsbE
VTVPEPAARRRRRPIFFYVLASLSLLTLCLAISVAGYYVVTQRTAADQGQTLATDVAGGALAEDFTLEAADGSTVTLSDLRGKVVLLNFWATWCPPCKAEMPDLEALHRDYGEEHDFVVVGVNLQEDAGKVQAFADANRISFPLLLDSDGNVSTRQYGVRTLPTSIILDREGRIRDAWNGQIPLASMLERLEKVW